MAPRNRPFSRSLVKIGTRILLGNRRAHYQDWLPGLKLTRPTGNGLGVIEYRRSKIAALHSVDVLKAEAGSTVYLVGSGPSIAESDLTEIEPLSAILLNGAIHLTARGVRPLAVAIEDERFIWRHFDLMRERIPGQSLLLLSVSVIRAICECDAGWLGDKRIILIDDIRKPYGGPRRRMEEIAPFDFVTMDGAGAAGLSSDPDRGVFQGGSVAISALQFALFCRPQQLGFIGIDISNGAQPRFYEEAGDVAFSRIARAEDRILSYFALARNIAARNGIELRNYSRISALAKCGIDYDGRFSRTTPE